MMSRSIAVVVGFIRSFIYAYYFKSASSNLAWRQGRGLEALIVRRGKKMAEWEDNETEGTVNGERNSVSYNIDVDKDLNFEK
jgi:hypothetical protein